MKVYIDYDVILDNFYSRKDFFEDSQKIFILIEKNIIKGYVSSLIIWNLFYLLSKYLGDNEARKKIKEFRSIINIVPIDSKIIDLSLNSDVKDFEDSVQFYAAITEGIDIFITRNKKDYPKNSITIMNSKEFINFIRTHPDYQDII
jgi:hypothetical protein